MSTTSEPFIPLSEPCLEGNEWAYVKECLDTGWVSSAGSFVSKFEEKLAEYVGVEHAVAVVNGTSALHTALLLSDVRPGDEVLVSTLTFAASVNAIRYCGAEPVLIDAEPDHWQISPLLVEKFLTQNCTPTPAGLINTATGRRVSAIVPVHILGHPVDLDAIQTLADRFGLAVIEDAAESLGAKYKGRPIGRSGNAVCFSFNGNKTITAGAGGAIATNDADLAARARHLTTQAKCDPVEYVHDEVGFNYRMPNPLAAIGVAQLELLDSFIGRKRSIAKHYDEELAPLGFDWHRESNNAFSTCWLATARVNPERTGVRAVELRDALQQRGIQTRRLWQPMHRNAPYANCPAELDGTADHIFEQALSFPSSPNLTNASLDRICDAVRDIVGLAASRHAA